MINRVVLDNRYRWLLSSLPIVKVASTPPAPKGIYTNPACSASSSYVDTKDIERESPKQEKVV